MNERIAAFAVFSLLVFGWPSALAEEPKPKAHAEILELVDEVAKEVEEIRGLSFKKPFARKVVTSAEIEEIAREKIAEELPPEKLAAMNRLYARMGFLPRGVDLADCYATFLKAGAAGLYDPDTKTLYIVGDYSPVGAKPIIFHELVHALEDQYYDLSDRMRRFMEDSDRAAGVQGLVEGSANYQMGQYLRRHPDVLRAFMADQMALAGKQTKMLTELPVWLVAGMGMYPYFNAVTFVYRATGGDVKKIADLYARMPESTEQVLHPEKYLENPDYPYRIRIGPLKGVLPSGWSRIRGDSVGELGVGFLLNELAGGPQQLKLLRVMSPSQKVTFRGRTKTASEGWDGDWVVGFKGPDGACAFVWASRWDTEADATEFATTYRELLPAKWKILGLSPATAEVEVQKDRVLIVDGFPEDALKKILAAAWKKASFLPDERDEADCGE